LNNNFILLKRTYPISKYNRYCDGYLYIINKFSDKELKIYNIDVNKLQKIIKKGEKYIYLVGKENGDFKTLCLSFYNYEIIRNNIFKYDDI